MKHRVATTLRLGFPLFLLCVLCWTLSLGGDVWRQREAVEARARDAFEAVLDELHASLTEQQAWRAGAATRDQVQSLLTRKRSELSAIRRISVITPQGQITDDTDPTQIDQQAPMHWLKETYRAGSVVWNPEPGLLGLERQLTDERGDTRAVVVVLAKISAGTQLAERSRTAIAPRAIIALALAGLASAWLSRRLLRQLNTAWQPWEVLFESVRQRALADLDSAEQALDLHAGLKRQAAAQLRPPTSPLPPASPPAPGLDFAKPTRAWTAALVLAVLMACCAAWMGLALQDEYARTLTKLEKGLTTQWGLNLQRQLENLPSQGGDPSQQKRAEVIQRFQEMQPNIDTRHWEAVPEGMRLRFELKPREATVTSWLRTHWLDLLGLITLATLAIAGLQLWIWHQGYARPMQILGPWLREMQQGHWDRNITSAMIGCPWGPAHALGQAALEATWRVAAREHMVDWKRECLAKALPGSERLPSSSATEMGPA